MEERTGFEEYIRCDKRVSAFNGPSAKRKDIKSFLVVFTLYVSLDCVILPTIGPSAYQSVGSEIRSQAVFRCAIAPL